MEALEKRLYSLENDRDRVSQYYENADEIQENINIVKNEINSIVDEKTKSSIFRSKIRWYKEGEKKVLNIS